MKLIIAGGRDFKDYEMLKQLVDHYIHLFAKKDEFITVISGCAKGADSLGEAYAREREYKVERYRAEWSVYGKSAGPIRNEKMAKAATDCICFWDTHSPGTANMIDTARNNGVRLIVHEY